MTKKTDISVPEGHFQSLQTRLSAIPSQEQAPRGIRKAAPYLAYAASLAALVLMGNAVLRQTAVPAQESSDWDYVSYLAQSLDPDGLVELKEADPLSDDEIVSYLLASNLSVEQVNELYYEENH